MADVDILIPCAGSGKFIEETLRSISAQTHGEFRAVLCDNACAHGEYSEQLIKIADRRFEYVRFDERLPITANWQRCLGQVNAEYFCFLHDDDLWEPNFLEVTLSPLAKHGSIFEYTLGMHQAFQDGAKPFTSIEEETRRIWEFLASAPWPVRRTALSIGSWGHMCCALFRTRCVGFDLLKNWNADQGYISRMSCLGPGAVAADTCTRIRRHSAASTNRFSRAQAARESLALLRENLNLLAEDNVRVAEHLISYAPQIGGPGLFKVAQAAFSWPMAPELAKIGKSILRDQTARDLIGSYSKAARILTLLPDPAWVVAALLMDFVHYQAYSKQSADLHA